KADDYGQEGKDNGKGERHMVQLEKRRRPNKVQDHLRQPKLHRQSGRVILQIGPPSRHRDHYIKDRPGRRKNPIWRIESWFLQSSIPCARQIGRADRPANANNEKDEEGKRFVPLCHSSTWLGGDQKSIGADRHVMARGGAGSLATRRMTKR